MRPDAVETFRRSFGVKVASVEWSVPAVTISEGYSCVLHASFRGDANWSFHRVFLENSHIRSLAETFWVDLPNVLSLGFCPGQVCPPPSIIINTTSDPSFPAPYALRVMVVPCWALSAIRVMTGLREPADVDQVELASLPGVRRVDADSAFIAA